MRKTAHEHFVPEAYLRKFSHDKRRIYLYDKLCKNEPKLVGVSDVCVKRNIYESRNQNGDYVEHNVLEKELQKIENDFFKTVRTIERAIPYKSKQCQCFLTKNEKESIRNMMVSQFLRTPQMIELATNKAQEISSDNDMQCNTKKMALNACLPISEHTQKTELWNTVSNWFQDMGFVIGYTNDNSIITGDKPIVIYKENKAKSMRELNPDLVVYPLTSNLVLYMHPRKSLPVGHRNTVMKMSKENIEMVRKMVVANSNRWIVAIGPNKDEELESIIKSKIT